MKTQNVFDTHKLRIAKQTLKMHDLGANIMGGPTKEESRQTLREFGWSDLQIAQLENPNAGHTPAYPKGRWT